MLCYKTNYTSSQTIHHLVRACALLALLVFGLTIQPHGKLTAAVREE